MILHLFSLFLLALPDPVIDGEQLRAAETTWAIRAAVCTEDGCDERTGALLAVIAAEETRGRAGVRGDHGGSCGRFQLGVVLRRGVACDALDADPYLDARTARDAIHALEAYCGSTFSAMCGYATGKCHLGVDYAERRCAFAGGC